MGNTCSENTQEEQQQPLIPLKIQYVLDNFENLYKNKSTLYGKADILQNRHQNSHHLCLLVFDIDDPQEFQQQQVTFLDREHGWTNPNITIIQAVHVQEFDTFFSSVQRICILVDYIDCTFAESLKKRKNNFTEDELWDFGEQISGALCFYQKKRIAMRNLSFYSIYCSTILSGKTVYKLSDPTLIESQPLWVEFERCKPKKPHLYLSPEALVLIKKKQQVNYFKSSVFSLGMMLLHLSTAISLDELYEYDKQTINTERLNEQIKSLESIYSKSWCFIISELLKIDNRGDCIEVDNLFQQSKDTHKRVKNLPQSEYLICSELAGRYGSNNYTLDQFVKKHNRVNLNNYDKSSQPILIQQMVDELHAKSIMAKNVHHQIVEQNIYESYQNGGTYTGQTLNAVRHGQGKFVFPDGSFYEGQFQNNRMNGKGVLYYKSGQKAYEGVFDNDKYHNFGKSYNEKPQNGIVDHNNLINIGNLWRVYEGDFQFGVKQGFGKYTFTNGDQFSGQFESGFPNGQGTFEFFGGQQVFGLWEKGKLVKKI